MTSAVRRRPGATTVTLLSTHILALFLVLLLTVGLTACNGGSDDTTPAAGDATAPVTSSPTGDATDDATDQPTDEPTQQPTQEPTSDQQGTAVPIYFAGDTASRSPRLFREFHRITGDPLTEAARLVAGGGDALDPDYRTLWPQVEITAVTATDGVLLVEIGSDAFTERPDGMSRREARLAVQQLVRTLQGVQQERVPVQVLRRSGPARLFGLSTEAPFGAASTLKTLNHINITSPAEGDTISKADSGGMLKVTGVANSFEASGPCRLIADDVEVALVPYMSDGWMGDRLFPFTVELPLTDVGTGDVIVQCDTDDPSGGAEGNGPDVDTKVITVK